MLDALSLYGIALIVTLIGTATPVLLAATGELVVEKAGVLNLGVEGMMIFGAIAGFIAAVSTGSPVYRLYRGGDGQCGIIAGVCGINAVFLGKSSRLWSGVNSVWHRFGGVFGA